MTDRLTEIRERFDEYGKRWHDLSLLERARLHQDHAYLLDVAEKASALLGELMELTEAGAYGVTGAALYGDPFDPATCGEYHRGRYAVIRSLVEALGWEPSKP